MTSVRSAALADELPFLCSRSQTNLHFFFFALADEPQLFFFCRFNKTKTPGFFFFFPPHYQTKCCSSLEQTNARYSLLLADELPFFARVSRQTPAFYSRYQTNLRFFARFSRQSPIFLLVLPDEPPLFSPVSRRTPVLRWRCQTDITCHWYSSSF